MPALGCAALYSKEDKRFRTHISDITVGLGMEIPDELKEKKKEWEKKYGFLPDDLTFSWEKY